ncbi:MAG: universal stress protein [Nitrosomonas sp.]
MKLFENILYVSEGAVDQKTSIMRAVSLAENNQGNLTVMDVVPVISASMNLPGTLIVDKVQSTLVEQRRKMLEELIEPYKKRLHIHLDVSVGTTFLEVIRTVLRNGHDLLIKPAENPGFIERLFGSNDTQLLRNCPCPVWLTRAEEKSKYEHILAAVDFEPNMSDVIVEQELNLRILGISGSLAFSDFASLHAIHVWDAPAETMLRTMADDSGEARDAYVEGVRSSHERAYNRLQQQLIERIGKDNSDYLSPEFHLRRGNAASVIPEIAKQLHADLVVMGTVARTGIPGLIIGNTAEAVLEQIQCSVLAIKPPGFVSPVQL